MNYMKKSCLFILFFAFFFNFAFAQEKKVVQNRPYIDMRTLHFGILFGFHLMDMEVNNVGPQVLEDGTTETIVCDVDNWNPGFTVGVMGELRLNQYFSLRMSPSMHFGQRHFKFNNLTNPEEEPQQQTLKSTYVAIPFDLKFASQRYNNIRPYISAGITPMFNITGKKQDILQLNKSDVYLNFSIGCDNYLPFFKFIPELRFCYGLSNCIDKNHVNELTDATLKKFSTCVDKGHSKMIILTLYFE